METATATTAVTNSFLRDSYLFTLKTRVKEVSVDSADSTILSVLFEDTVFHPQGGGQPSDSGFISIGDDIKLPVLKVTIDREKNTVYHQVSAADAASELSIGKEVTLTINEEFRMNSARLHSAGHLIDMGVSNFGLTDWQAGKGYHFADGPYVEYTIGAWPEGIADKLKNYLNEELNKMIEKSAVDDSAIVNTFTYADAKRDIPNLPAYLPEGGEVRWVRLNATDAGCPCGGTHVKHIKDIKRIIVTKVSKKGKKGKVSYQVE